MTSKYTIGGVEYETVAKEEIHSYSGVLYNKSFWSQLNNKGRLDLVKQIKSKQQILFTAQTILINDPEKLINHYSFSKTVAELQRSMYKYGVNAVFTVVKPHSFDGTNAGQLEKDINGSLIATNIFDRYLRLSVDDVV